MPYALSRRNFLKLGGAAAATAIIASSRYCAFAEPNELVIDLRSVTIPESVQLLTSLVKFFAAKSNINIKLRMLSRQQLSDALSEAAQTGSGPDVLESSYLQAYEHANMLTDLSEICEQLGAANGGWNDVAREMCVVDGQWRAMPHFYESRLMVYRQDFFEQVGTTTFPTTWNDLLILGTKLKAVDKPLGFTLGHTTGDGNCFAYSLLWSFGGSLTDEMGKVSLDTPATRQAITFVQQLYHDAMSEAVTTWEDLSNNTEFLKGNISCTYNASSILWQAQHDEQPFVDKISHAPFPAGPAGTFILPEIHTVAVPKFSKNANTAQSFLGYLNSPDIWLPLAPGSFALVSPLLKAYESHPAMPWITDPRLSGFKGFGGATGKPINYPAKPSAQASLAASKFIIIDMFARVCTGQATVDQSIKQATQAADEIFKEN